MGASGAANATSVTLSGVVDTGLTYGWLKTQGEESKDSFGMVSGGRSGPRLILKAREEIGGGYEALFHLESGFALDTGTLGQSGRMFGREARLSLKTPYGMASAGRMGGFTAGMGTYDWFGQAGDAFDGGWSGAIDVANWFVRNRYDNMLVYETPEMNGFTAAVQYSLSIDGVKGHDDALSGTHSKDRYAAAALFYRGTSLDAVLAADTILRRDSNPTGAAIPEGLREDARAVSAAVRLRLTDITLNAGIQVGTGETGSFMINSPHDTLTTPAGESVTGKGFTVSLGASAPVPVGKVIGAVYYGSIKADTEERQINDNINAVLAYEYPLGPRSILYTAVAYKHARARTNEGTFDREITVTGLAGLTHRF